MNKKFNNPFNNQFDIGRLCTHPTYEFESTETPPHAYSDIKVGQRQVLPESELTCPNNLNRSSPTASKSPSLIPNIQNQNLFTEPKCSIGIPVMKQNA